MTFGENQRTLPGLRGRRSLSPDAASEGWSLPDVLTLVVVFLLYTNAPAVAVRFHGLPAGIARCVGLLLGVPLLYHLFVRRRGLIADRALAWAVAFVAVQAVSLLFCEDPERAAGTVITSVLEGVVLFFLFVNVVRTSQMLRRVIWTLLLAGAFLGTLSGWQYKFGSMRKVYGGFAQVGISLPLDTSPYEEVDYERRASGPLGEVGRYAQIMLMLIPLGFLRFLGERNGWMRWTGLGTMMLTMLGVMLSFTRGAAIGFVVVLSTMLALRYVKPSRGAFLLALGCLPIFFSDTYAERLQTLTMFWYSVENEGRNDVDDVDTSFQGRDTEVRAAALMYLEHPLLGVGPGLYPPNYAEYADRVGGRVRREERQPHSLYLGMAAELGTVGLGTFLILIFGVLRGLYRATRRCQLSQPDLAFVTVGFLFSMVAYLTTGLFLHFAFGRYFWMMLAFTAAASRIADTEAYAPSC